MNNAEYVTNLIAGQKAQGVPLQQIAWNAAVACVGWAYVYGARGEYCTPANRRSRYSPDHETIKSKCKNFDGSSSVGCAGCQWYPGSKYTRFFDCRGFTYWVLKQVYGWELQGAGCTSQWNKESNWKAKGKISDGIPANTLVCLFYSKDNKEVTWEHTGFSLNGETVECSSGVQYFKKLNKKWTHWAVPACIDGDVPTPTPTPTPDPEPTPGGSKPTIKRGSKGPYVTLAQTELKNKGYDLGPCGVDGDFGRATEKAVKQFQKDHGLTADGIVGPKTWAALDSTEPVTLYTVTIQHLTVSEADAVIAQYPGATKTAE